MASGGVLLLLLLLVTMVVGPILAQDTTNTKEGDGQCTVVHQLSYEDVQQLLIGSKQCTFSSDNLLLALVQLQQEVKQLKGSYNQQPKGKLPNSDKCNCPNNK